jgi:hypothetical protein
MIDGRRELYLQDQRLWVVLTFIGVIDHNVRWTFRLDLVDGLVSKCSRSMSGSEILSEQLMMLGNIAQEVAVTLVVEISPDLLFLVLEPRLLCQEKAPPFECD